MHRITRTIGTTLAAGALLLTVSSAALAHQPGLADGWYDPAEATLVTTSATTVGAAPAVHCSGHEVGLPDGCWEPEGAVTAASTTVTASAGTRDLVPSNVR